MNDEKLLQLIAVSNPVPDPATLHPEPGDETPLLLAVYQGSGITGDNQRTTRKAKDPDRPTTEERPITEGQHAGRAQPEKITRRRAPVAAAVAMVIVAAVGVGAWLAASSGNEGDVVDQPAPTTITTTQAVVGPVGLIVTYDGRACDYSGPDRATLADEISLTFVNKSEDVVFAGLRLIPPDRIDELEPLVGTDFDWSNETFIEPTLFVQTGPGEEDTTRAFVAGAGTYVVDCTLLEGATRLHSWWPATFEMTP